MESTEKMLDNTDSVQWFGPRELIIQVRNNRYWKIVNRGNVAADFPIFPRTGNEGYNSGDKTLNMGLWMGFIDGLEWCTVFFFFWGGEGGWDRKG